MPTIKLLDSNGRTIDTIWQKQGETIAASLRRMSYHDSYPCGGRGSCGKCRCKVTEGVMEPVEEEKRMLTEEELAAGIRLMCRAVFESDGALILPEKEVAIESEEVTVRQRKSYSVKEKEVHKEITGDRLAENENSQRENVVLYDVAADIGTTTIALMLIGHETGERISSSTMNNSQRIYGADVLSRISAANGGALQELQRLVWQDVQDGMDRLTDRAGTEGRVVRLVVSANTTMEHLFAGDSCETLGCAPFTPVSLELRRKKGREWYSDVRDTYAELDVVLLPGISAFVGADILSGMYKCNMMKSRKPVLFLDLGTNGEMVLKTESGYLATSTAAGPALEGANISCGVPGVAGAISSISRMGSCTVIRTIKNKPPVGLCGTGVLELVYELMKSGIVDRNGNLELQYREQGFPVMDGKMEHPFYFTQEDMRQFQMAKAAIRSGIELLLQEGGISASAIDKVYLAGGLGYKLNVYKAAGIGLIPSALREKTYAVGNTSLEGAVKYLRKKKAPLQLEEMRTQTKEMNLAVHPGFEEYYYRYMEL